MKSESKYRIAVILYTYGRTDDARINMEVIRNVWSRSKLLKHIIIIHAYNGKREWWPEKYLEDDLIYLDNPGHFKGATLLMDEGLSFVNRKYPFIEHAIFLASDTWLLRPEYVERIIQAMISKKMYLASCGWNWPVTLNMQWRDVALDFFVINVHWSIEFGFFPLRYMEFVDRYDEILDFLGIYSICPEQVVLARYKQALLRAFQVSSEFYIPELIKEHIYLMREREPVNRAFERRYYWPDIGIIGNHDPLQKQEILKEWKIKVGAHGKRFIDAKNLAYFNEGRIDTLYTIRQK